MESTGAARSDDLKLRKLRERLLTMAARVEQMIVRALEAVKSRDTALAARVVEEDEHVNRAELEIDTLCLDILGTHHPDGRDLRLVASTFKMVTDLERIGDQAVNIAERAIDLSRERPVPLHPGIGELGTSVRTMVKQAIDSFVDGDAEQAKAVIDADDAVDDLYLQVFRDMTLRMNDQTQSIETSVALQSVAKYLERVGDHATNIAQHVFYLVRGDDIRHPAARRD
jgi:phosphate transport system protein